MTVGFYGLVVKSKKPIVGKKGEKGRFVTLRSGRVIFLPEGKRTKWADVRERIMGGPVLPKGPQTRRQAGLPKMPPLKTAGIGREVAERAKVRAEAMREKYGVKFSRFVPNPLGVKQGKKIGMWWADLPQAVYGHRTTKPLHDPRVDEIIEATFQKWRSDYDYVSFNTLKFGSGLSFEQVFGSIRARRDKDPRSVSVSVNRFNDAAYVRIK